MIKTWNGYVALANDEYGRMESLKYFLSVRIKSTM